jgi:multicomponent Na+:H+ antiporter subunit B
MYLAGEYAGLRTLSPRTVVELAEGTGAASYVGVGLVGLGTSVSFMKNFLPLGRPGDLLSSGTILILNFAVGLAVAAGFVLLLTEFLEQTLEVRGRSRA